MTRNGVRRLVCISALGSGTASRGVTHILGGVGLLIPNVPRLTEWVYAGLAINLFLAFYSQLNGGGSTWDKVDPILVMAFVFASYVLRRCMRANKWSI
jgi:uncharacterized membrane protein